MILALAMLGVSLALVGGAASGQVTTANEFTREAVWRAIFARPEMPVPNPEERAKIALGSELFRDVRLSGAEKASCASCHDPERAFTDGRKTAIGPGGAVLSRNAPTLYNLAWATSFFWDGRSASLVDQAKFPIEAANELAGEFPTISRRLSDDPQMSARFAEAFPGKNEVTESSILEALAAYERSLVSPKSRFDKWVEGDDTALTDQEFKGFDVFVGKGGCVSCHGGWRFTDDAFHDVGLPGSDPGRGAIPGGAPGLPEFKTPSLREAGRTEPYMHDGSLATLRDVVDHYSGGVINRPSVAATVVRDLRLSEEEKTALVAFLNALSSEPKSHTTDETTRPMLKK